MGADVAAGARTLRFVTTRWAQSWPRALYPGLLLIGRDAIYFIAGFLAHPRETDTNQEGNNSGIAKKYIYI